jgi:hypothetical protein
MLSGRQPEDGEVSGGNEVPQPRRGTERIAKRKHCLEYRRLEIGQRGREPSILYGAAETSFTRSALR